MKAMKDKETGEDATDAVGVDPSNKPAATLVSGVAALTTVLAAVGISDGVIGRAVGERPELFGIAVFLSLVAGVLAVNAATRVDSKASERRQLVWSNFVLLGGLGLGILAAMLVWSATRTPSVAVVEGGGPDGRWVDVSVTSSGLDSREHVQLLVEALRPDRRQGTQPLVPNGQPLHVASLGSDADGNLSYRIRVPILPSGAGFVGARAYVGDQPKDCYAHPDKDNGCVSVYVRSDDEPLQLSGTWSKTSALTLRLRTRSSARPVALIVMGRRPHQSRWQRIAEWHLAPDARARFRHTLRVPRARTYGAICAAAYIDIPSGASCPPTRSATDAEWLRYRMPHQ